jgi:hypothetical protein
VGLGGPVEETSAHLFLRVMLRMFVVGWYSLLSLGRDLPGVGVDQDILALGGEGAVEVGLAVRRLAVVVIDRRSAPGADD